MYIFHVFEGYQHEILGDENFLKFNTLKLQKLHYCMEKLLKSRCRVCGQGTDAHVTIVVNTDCRNILRY